MRRNALQELPIEQFLIVNPDFTPKPTTKPIKTNKRPLSPGEPVLFSPAKRRILASEGIFSPEKTLKSPLSSLRGSYALPTRFSNVLTGPESPARVLNFGVPKSLAGDPQKRAASYPIPEEQAPTKHQSSSKRLAPSPELKQRTIRSTQTSDSMDTLPDGIMDDTKFFTAADSTSQSDSFYLIPRVLPPRPDPHSVHYPGFVVFQDPHIAGLPPSGTGDSLSKLETTDEDSKENSWNPPRETKKLAASGVKCPLSSTKVKPCSVAPKRSNFFPAESLSPQTKLSGKIHGMSIMARGKRERRQMLMDELDQDEDLTSSEE